MNNKRKISLVTYGQDSNWASDIPSENWLCILVGNDVTNEKLEDIAQTIIKKNVCYVCSIGAQAEYVHDFIDEELVSRAVQNGEQLLYSIITTWHDELDEGIWFALNSARHEKIKIKRIVIVDMSSGSEFKRIKDAIEKSKKTDYNIT